jgi:hypothetical protein
VTTSQATRGDHKAGLTRGLSSGSQGKLQAPSPGQTLHFLDFDFGIICNALMRVSIVAAVFGIASQELLREISVVMVLVLFGEQG